MVKQTKADENKKEKSQVKTEDKNMVGTKEAAEFLGVSPAFLERDRWSGPTIPFVRLGNGKGAVRYLVVTLQSHIKARTVQAREVDNG